MSDSWIIKSANTISVTFWSLAIFLIYSFFPFSLSPSFLNIVLPNKGLSFPAVSKVIKTLSFSSRIGKFALIPWVVTKNPFGFL